MKITVYLLLLTLLSQPEHPKNTEVYICNSPNGKRFHYSENCSGLQACTHKIEKIALDEARKAGKTRCGYER